MHAAEIQQQLEFEAGLRRGHRVLATISMEEGGLVSFIATVVRVLDDSVVVKAVDRFRLLDEVPEQIVIPRFCGVAWSEDYRVQPLPLHVREAAVRRS